MDFSLTQEQVLLQDSIARLVAEQCEVERHRKLAKTELGFDPALWRQFAELGWLAVPFSEEQGGIGGGAVDVMVTCEALGRCVLREPFLTTVITCGGFLRRAGTARQQAHYLPGIMNGGSQWAFAFAEQASGYDLAAIETRARKTEQGYVLNGHKIAVLNGHCADFIVLSARLEDAAAAPTLFIVDGKSAGLERESFSAVDGSRGAHLALKDVSVADDCLLGAAGEGLGIMEAVIDDSILAMGAEALGAMQALLDATVEYTRTREQFGQPISKFQALQHRMADMYLKVEELRSLLYNAAIALDENDGGAAAACAALKVKLAEAGRHLSYEAVQLHGGIGMTDELIVGHHFKRLLLLAKLYGDEPYYLRRYMALAAQSAA